MTLQQIFDQNTEIIKLAIPKRHNSINRTFLKTCFVIRKIIKKELKLNAKIEYFARNI
jgi:hypothetical protein